MPDKYGPRMSLDELAEVLGIARATVNNQISDGSFPIATYRDAGKRWVDYRDVDAYIDQCRARATAAPINAA
jgi:predicted DNA-binding transcriptional regulator AlpA